jgi:glyoxylase-like metal-dependent hydrolase (beta-lactamase superfamily II)/ferredoxin
MADVRKRHPGNATGDFFVDTTCIDCDTCRWMAPSTFGDVDGQAIVKRQPENEAEETAALRALVACPTASIGTTRKHDLAPILASFPLPIAGGVHHCGFHAESSFGAASYLIVRPAGNVLVDSPRFAGALVKRLEALGGVRTMFLTHVDDVADHERFRRHFGCERILHVDDAHGELAHVEHRIDGQEPIRWDDEITLVPAPGHTRGSSCLLWRQPAGEGFLFSGDHAAWDDERRRIIAFRSACWYDWGVQTESMQRLLAFDFDWLLPGHGRRCHLPAAEMRAKLADCVAWMRRAA